MIGFDGTDTPRLAVSPEQAPPPEALPGFTLTPAKGVDPMRTNTSIGNLEWTTYEFPPGEEMYLALGTAHGPVAVPMGESRLNWSTDNVTWAGTTTSVEPWRLIRAGEDVVVFDGGAVRYAWDGAAWVEAARLDAQDAYRMAFGPKGAVAAEGSGAGVTYSFAPDSVHFTKARSGPSKDTLTGTDSRCNSLGSGPGDTPGPLLATSTGFVALTASNPEKWNESSTCSPVVWTSPDGERGHWSHPNHPSGRAPRWTTSPSVTAVSWPREHPRRDRAWRTGMRRSGPPATASPGSRRIWTWGTLRV